MSPRLTIWLKPIPRSAAQSISVVAIALASWRLSHQDVD